LGLLIKNWDKIVLRFGSDLDGPIEKKPRPGSLSEMSDRDEGMLV
jgi:hypothetical protein